MTFDVGPGHITYSPVLLLAVAVALSALVAFVVTRVMRVSGRRWVLVTVIALSPTPILFVAREHLPLLSAIPFVGYDYCFGDPGALHFVSFLFPPVVGLLTVAVFRATHAEARA